MLQYTWGRVAYECPYSRNINSDGASFQQRENNEEDIESLCIYNLIIYLSITCLGAEFGIEVGSSLSFVGQKSEIFDGSTLFTAKAGLFYSFVITNSLSLQPGINLAMKGGRSYNVLNRAYDRVHLNYIEIPVLLCFSLFKEKFDLYSGPYVGFLISYTENDDENRWTWEEDEIRNTDIGVSTGARYHFIKRLFVEIQFNHGYPRLKLQKKINLK